MVSMAIQRKNNGAILTHEVATAKITNADKEMKRFRKPLSHSKSLAGIAAESRGSETDKPRILSLTWEITQKVIKQSG